MSCLSQTVLVSHVSFRAIAFPSNTCLLYFTLLVTPQLALDIKLTLTLIQTLPAVVLFRKDQASDNIHTFFISTRKMMKIQALLNPLASERDEHQQTESPVPRSIPRSSPVPRSVPRSPTTSTSRSYTPSNSASTRQKVSKDAAVFVKGKFRGEINYPPYEAEDDEELAAKQKEHQIHPMGSIADYCRHIPYNSEKKDFLMKTGREGFDGMTCFLLLASSRA